MYGIFDYIFYIFVISFIIWQRKWFNSLIELYFD